MFDGCFRPLTSIPEAYRNLTQAGLSGRPVRFLTVKSLPVS